MSCPAGTYVATSGSTSPTGCSVCNAGTYSPLAGAARCTVCAAGRYLSDSGIDAAKHDSDSDCAACPKGKFMIDYDSLANEGNLQFLEVYQLDKIDSLRRQHSSEEFCVLCYEGSYSDKEASSSCTACPVSFFFGPRSRSAPPDVSLTVMLCFYFFAGWEIQPQSLFERR